MRVTLMPILGMMLALGWPWYREDPSDTRFRKFLGESAHGHFRLAVDDVKSGSGGGHIQFNSAYQLYEDTLPSRGPLTSAAYFHNLGNLALLTNRLPEAILAYHRGLKLNPDDADLRANLDYARAKVLHSFANSGRPEADAWPAWLYRPSPFQALAVALVLYSLVCILVMRWFMKGTSLIRAGVVLLLALFCGGYWVYLENELAWQEQHPLVVIAQDKLPLRKGNGPSYPSNPDLPFLARGMEARRLHERGGWLQIQFASGELGWVEKTAVLVDWPQTAELAH